MKIRYIFNINRLKKSTPASYQQVKTTEKQPKNDRKTTEKRPSLYIIV